MAYTDTHFDCANCGQWVLIGHDCPAAPEPRFRVMALHLRLDNIRKDGGGWLATFYGKPDIHGNAITVPVSDEEAPKLEPGRQYLFVESPEQTA